MLMSNNRARYGSTSLYCPGANNTDYIETNYGSAAADTLSTLEAWVYIDSASPSGGSIFGYINTSLNGGGPAIIEYGYPSAGGVEIIDGSSRTAQIPVNTNAWNHLAIDRNGNTVTLWTNGTNSVSKTISVTWVGTDIILGRYYTAGTIFKGNIQDFRYTLARKYTGAFTPPQRLMI